MSDSNGKTMESCEVDNGLQVGRPMEPAHIEEEKEDRDQKIRMLEERVMDMQVRLSRQGQEVCTLKLIMTIIISAIDHGMGWLFLCEPSGLAALKFATAWYYRGFSVSSDEPMQEEEDPPIVEVPQDMTEGVPGEFIRNQPAP